MVLDSSISAIAQEVLWTYSSVSEESGEKDFYIALEEIVAEEIACYFSDEDRIWVGREVHLQMGPYTVHARLTNVEPLLATRVGPDTKFLARYRTRPKDEGQAVATFLSETIRYPDERMEAIYRSLVGLNTIKHDLVRKLGLLLYPQYIEKWINNHYAQNSPSALAHSLRDRYPLFLLEGEVGSGKTALARSVGQRVATVLKTGLLLLVVNAQIRGGGHVGELTQNIVRTFTEAERYQQREQIPVIILLDEADALAQIRGGEQTHHEDDAGVNTLIQCIDRLRGHPIAVIFATNLLHSLDAAILRRAYAAYHFDRPTPEQRAHLFQRVLMGTDIDEKTIVELVHLTDPRLLPGLGDTPHRYTYSDIAQRVIPHAIEEAIYAKKRLTPEHLVNACKLTVPTPEARV
jgi:SpoVK/Ycf46/Vps4 family AAA+-type ATPase